MNFWKNLHPLLKREKDKDTRTASNAILHSIANSLSTTEQKIVLDRMEESLATASTEYLDYWGTWFGLVRKKDETDDHYRERMERYLLLGRGTIKSIIGGIRYYLQDTDSYINVYEPWKNIFKLDNSKLDGADHLQGEYYRSGVIDVSMGVPVDDNIMKVINAFKPVGVKVYTNYNPLMNKDNKVTYLGTQDSDLRTHIYLEVGADTDSPIIQLGLDDYNFKKVRLSNLSPFVLDKSKLDSNDILVNPTSNIYNADNLLVGTSEQEQLRENEYKQSVTAKPTVRYTFKGLINPDIRARVSLSFLNNAGVAIQEITSPEIKHNKGTMQNGFTQVDLAGVAPDKAAEVQVAIDNRSSYTDNLVKKSYATFHNDGKESFPVSFDLGRDLRTAKIVTKVEFTVKNLKNSGYLAIVDGQDTDNWEQLVPVSVTAKPPTVSDSVGFKLDNSKLDSDNTVIKPNMNIKPEPPIKENGTYTYELTTNKHALKPDAKNNRIFVKTNLDADIELKVKLSIFSNDMDMNYSVYLGEDGYYNGYKIKAFKLVSGDNPNLTWTPAPSEVDTPSPYYVDIINNTNVKLVERELRNTKNYNSRGAKLTFAKLHNRNIALKTGVPVTRQNFDKIDKLYQLSIPVVAGTTYTVLMNYASNDVDKAKKIVITLEDNQQEVVLSTPLYTDGNVKTFNGMYTAGATGSYLNLSIQNGTASDLYILNFKLGVD